MGSLYKKDINLFNNVNTSKNGKNYILRFAIILQLSFAIVAVGSYTVAKLERQSYEELLNFYNNMTTQGEINRIRENKELLSNLISRHEVYQGMINMFNEQRYLSVYLIEVIESLQSSDTVVNRFNYSNGVITLNATSLGITEGAAYAERLLLSNYFKDVVYRGVSTQGSNLGYSYIITLYIGDDNIANLE